MRSIKYLVVHCSATSSKATVEAIKSYWKNTLGWKNVGYHKIIEADGNIVTLAPDEMITNGVKGFNTNCLHVCYIGGVKNGKGFDTRTDAQKESLIKVLKQWKENHPSAIIQGHKDFPRVAKECPSFNAKDEYSDL